MRILHLVPSIQHPALVGPTRHYHFGRELAARHHLTLLAPAHRDLPATVMQELGATMERILLCRIPFGGSAPVHRLGGRRSRAVLEAMYETFHDLLQRETYDLVLLQGKHFYPLLADCPLPVVVDFGEAASLRLRTKMRFAPWPRKPPLWLRYRHTLHVETRLARLTPHIAFTAPRDRDWILGPESQAAILPNGVDPRFWSRRHGSPMGPPCVVFAGVMSHPPNEDAALHLVEDIVPIMRRALPDLEVFIVGRDPSRRLRAAARRSVGVRVTGYVEDMRPYFDRAALYVAPLRQSPGLQNKILEALAMQVPVVASPVVLEDLRLHGAEPPVVTVGDLAAFAEAAVQWLRQPEERRQLGLQGRRYVESHFSWRRSAAVLERLCLHAAAATGAPAPLRGFARTLEEATS